MGGKKTCGQGYDVLCLALCAGGSSLQWEMALDIIFLQKSQ